MSGNHGDLPISMLERRRAQRTSLAGESWLTVPATWPVQLTDVSLGGLAFASPYALEVGRTVAVRTTLGRDAFNGQIRVCWSRPRGSGRAIKPHYEIGAVFLPLDDHCRQALESFLNVSS